MAIKNCPRCKSTNVSVAEEYTFGVLTKYTITCLNCERKSVARTKKSAIKNWRSTDTCHT